MNEPQIFNVDTHAAGHGPLRSLTSAAAAAVGRFVNTESRTVFKLCTSYTHIFNISITADHFRVPTFPSPSLVYRDQLRHALVIFDCCRNGR